MTDLLGHMLADQSAAEAPFSKFPEDMPHHNLDLGIAVTAPPGAPEEVKFDDFAARSRNLARVFANQPRRYLVHAQCITLLRRRNPPKDTAAIFCDIWIDHGAELSQNLSYRWLISAATTFADHGATPAQRQAGEGLSTLFGMLKLTESERLFSGRASDTPFLPGKANSSLPLHLSPFAIHGGDLDRTMITRIWRAGHNDPAINHLTHRLLSDLISESRGIFARIRAMRHRRNNT